MKGKYPCGRGVRLVKHKAVCSNAWREIAFAWDDMLMGVQWGIGDGQHNMREDLRVNVANVLQVTHGLGNGNYLGLPSLSRNKKILFSHILENRSGDVSIVRAVRSFYRLGGKCC